MGKLFPEVINVRDVRKDRAGVWKIGRLGNGRE
jgi:hypothetical protein